MYKYISIANTNSRRVWKDFSEQEKIFLTFHYEIISDLQKSYNNSKKNTCIPSTQCPQCHMLHNHIKMIKKKKIIPINTTN